jgi:hypothetical protein
MIDTEKKVCKVTVVVLVCLQRIYFHIFSEVDSEEVVVLKTEVQEKVKTWHTVLKSLLKIYTRERLLNLLFKNKYYVVVVKEEEVKLGLCKLARGVMVAG